MRLVKQVADWLNHVHAKRYGDGNTRHQPIGGGGATPPASPGQLRKGRVKGRVEGRVIDLRVLIALQKGSALACPLQKTPTAACSNTA